MTIASSRNGVPIRLTDERWTHIANRHPELLLEREKLIETLGDPDMVQ